MEGLGKYDKQVIDAAPHKAAAVPPLTRDHLMLNNLILTNLSNSQAHNCSYPVIY